MPTFANSSTIDFTHQSTIDVEALWKNIREEVNTTRKPKINESNIENQTNQLYENRNNAVNINSTPTMVFSVIGDSDSFVPRPWPTTLFQTALIEAAKSGGETWILFRENDEVVSNVIQEAYEHYEAMEFGKDKKDIGDPNRHVKLINIAGKKINHPSSDTSGNINTNFHSYEHTQGVYEINVGDGEDQLLEFEKYISKQEVSFFSPKMNIKMPVPIAILVCEGDLKTIVHIAKALKENIPVIIMKGSGKAADLVLDYIDKNDEFRKKASISFGIQFDNDKYGLLQEYLGEIIKHKDLIGVFDLDHDDPLKLSNIVGEIVVSCWSMEHVIATTDNAPGISETKENTSGQGSSSFPDHGRTLKGFSLTWKLLQKNSVSPEENILNQSLEGFKRESRPHVLNPKYSTPTSLPLYFYFVYQLLQESKRLEDCGPILLLEALKANRCDYVRVLLAKGVKFKKADLPELYGQTVACEGCKEDPPCLHIEWILKQLEEDETNNMCHVYKNLKNMGGKWVHFPSPENVVANAAEALCRSVLRYEKCQCWVTGLVCSAIVKKLSKKANNLKEQILSVDLEEHSKLFEQRCIALMNSMYNENPEYAIDLMDDEAHVWGIHSSPLVFAYENFMYDVVAHTCSQKNMNKLWYNKLPPDLEPFLKVETLTHPKVQLTIKWNDEGECTNITSVWESDPSKERCPQEDWTVQAVAAVYLLFSNLLLVNLVIAMFSFTFERVQQNAEKLWRFERYTVINDYDWRIPSSINLVFLPYRFGCCRKKRKMQNKL